MNPTITPESEDWKDYFAFDGEALDFKKTFENLGYSEDEYSLETVEIDGQIFPVAYAKPRFKNKWVLVDCEKNELFITNNPFLYDYFYDLSKNYSYEYFYFTINFTIFLQYFEGFHVQINVFYPIYVFNNFKKTNFNISIIRLANITRFQKLELEFGKRATILLGENGTGKTSILRAILLGLIGNNREVRDNISSKLNFLLATNAPKNKATNNILFLKEGNIDLKLDNEIYQAIDLNYTKHRKRVQIDKLVVANSLDIIYDEIYLEQLILAFPQIQTNTTFGRVSDNVRKMGEEKLPNVHDILGLLYNEPLDILGDLARWIFGLDADSRKEGEHNRNKKNVLEKLFKVLSEVIGKKIWFHETDQTDDQIWIGIETPGKPDAPEISLFQLLSQGFKNVFAWVGHIVRRMAESKDYAPDFNEQAAIILIDEIDTYLHPKWQRTILKTLLDNFPNTQFIISTHSPLVANYIPPTTVSSEDLRVYVLEVDSPEPRRLDKVYGQDIKTIFAELGVAERPIEASKKIEALFIDLETVKTVEELSEINTRISQLKEILDPQDSIFVSLEYAFGDAEWRLDNPAENDIFE